MFVLTVRNCEGQNRTFGISCHCQWTNHKRHSRPGHIHETLALIQSFGANMPAEFAAINAFVREQKQANALAQSRRDSLDPRRISMTTCNYLTDKNRNGTPPFTNGKCCKKRMCCTKFTPRDVLVLRESLIDRPRNMVDRRLFLSNRYLPRLEGAKRGTGVFYCDTPAICRLPCFTSSQSSRKQSLPITPLDKTEVCASFYHWAYNVSRDQMRGDLSERIHTTKRRRIADATKQWEIEEWLVDLSKYYQLQPDSNLVLLPFANRQSVYEIYQVEDGKDTETSASYFFKVWRTSPRTSHIRLRKHLRFTKCDKCVELRERKSRTMDNTLLEQIRAEEKAHYDFIKAERGGYYLRRSQAVKKPEEYLSLIIDGADWYSYAVPYFATKTHDSSKIYRAPIYLMGVIAHGRGSKCYIVPGHFKQGTNVVLDVLIRYLRDIKDSGANLPRKIYIQLDNTCKQNKNKFLIGILGFLVFLDVHDKILVCFLPKGHTHEDIDQLFSRLVIALMCRDARSVAELMSIIRASYRDKLGRHTETEEVEAVANLSEWILPYLNVPGFRGLTQYRQFMIKKRGGEVVVRVRKETTEGLWTGIENKTDYTKVFSHAPPR